MFFFEVVKYFIVCEVGDRGRGWGVILLVVI